MPPASTNISAASAGVRMPQRRGTAGSSSHSGDRRGRHRHEPLAYLETSDRPQSGERRKPCWRGGKLTASRCGAARMWLLLIRCRSRCSPRRGSPADVFLERCGSFWDRALAQAPLLIWPWLHQTFGEALVEVLGPEALTDTRSAAPFCLSPISWRRRPPARFVGRKRLRRL